MFKNQPKTVVYSFVTVCISFLIWTSWELCRLDPHPFYDFSNGAYTDHFSHMNAARLFMSVGTDIWRKPASQMLRPYSPEEIENLPADVKVGASWTGGIFHVDGWPENKPYTASWTDRPRLYPPGDLILVAPIALLYHFTSLSAKAANMLLIILFLGYAHISLFLFFRSFFEDENGNGPVGFLTIFLVYSASILWTLEGFYDFAAVTPLLLSARYLSERRGLAAVVAYCAAAAIHFRCFFLAPLALYAVYIIIKDKQWRFWRFNHWIAVGCATILAFATFFSFFTLWPTLGHLPVDKIVRVNIWVPDSNHAWVKVFFVVSAVIASVLIRSRAWFDLGMLCWFVGMLTSLHEVREWHVLIPMAWLGIPVLGAQVKNSILVRDARLAFFIFTAVVVFYNPLIPAWIQKVFEISAPPNTVQQKLDPAFLKNGDSEEAIKHYQEAVRLNPADPEAQSQLATAWQWKIKMGALADIAAMNDFAWKLATSPNELDRNGPMAVKLAEFACTATEYRVSIMVGTLAAAYAEAGRFDDAIAAAEKAITLAKQNGQTELVQKNSELLKLYRAHQPYHEPAANPAATSAH